MEHPKTISPLRGPFYGVLACASHPAPLNRARALFAPLDFVLRPRRVWSFWLRTAFKRKTVGQTRGTSIGQRVCFILILVLLDLKFILQLVYFSFCGRRNRYSIIILTAFGLITTFRNLGILFVMRGGVFDCKLAYLIIYRRNTTRLFKLIAFR